MNCHDCGALLVDDEEDWCADCIYDDYEPPVPTRPIETVPVHPTHGAIL